MHGDDLLGDVVKEMRERERKRERERMRMIERSCTASVFQISLSTWRWLENFLVFRVYSRNVKTI